MWIIKLEVDWIKILSENINCLSRIKFLERIWFQDESEGTYQVIHVDQIQHLIKLNKILFQQLWTYVLIYELILPN